MQQRHGIIDAPASHLTTTEVLKLARDHRAQPYDCGRVILIQRGSFQREFTASDMGLFRAAPIRSFLGAEA